jgi:hypothetical protein
VGNHAFSQGFIIRIAQQMTFSHFFQLLDYFICALKGCARAAPHYFVAFTLSVEIECETEA